jgi:hypothetical protein
MTSRFMAPATVVQRAIMREKFKHYSAVSRVETYRGRVYLSRRVSSYFGGVYAKPVAARLDSQIHPHPVSPPPGSYASARGRTR